MSDELTPRAVRELADQIDDLGLQVQLREYANGLEPKLLQGRRDEALAKFAHGVTYLENPTTFAAWTQAGESIRRYLREEAEAAEGYQRQEFQSWSDVPEGWEFVSAGFVSGVWVHRNETLYYTPRNSTSQVPWSAVVDHPPLGAYVPFRLK